MPPTAGELTATQRDLLDLICTTTAVRGYPPSVEELARATWTAPSAIREMLAAPDFRRLEGRLDGG